MADFSADNAIVTDCDPSELSYFLTPEEIELLLEPFGDETPTSSRDCKVNDVESFMKQNTKAATARDMTSKMFSGWLWENKRETKS